nr:hypothetical protein [Tanacetum cinerariifolium]
MTGNISYLSEYEPFNGGYVSFGHERGKITSKGSIKTGTGPDWLCYIDTLTNSMNYVPVVVAGTSSTNISGTNEAAKKEDAILDNNAPQKEQEEVNGDKEVPESSGNSNPTASTKVSTNDSFKLATSLTVETKVPTISTPVPTDSLFVPPVTSGRLMGIEYGVSWVWEQFHMGCWGECFGTVLMDAGAL